MQAFTLRNNRKLVTFSNNTFESAYKLTIIDTSLENSENNDFPLLSVIEIENVAGNLNSVLSSITPTNVINLTLSNVDVNDEFDFAAYTKLFYLKLYNISITSLTLENLPLTYLNISSPTLT
jgi:hypothetical protein